ncbi:MAG: sedoheptulokinase [Armatimonadota bacterium]
MDTGNAMMLLGLDIGTSKIAAVLVDDAHRVRAVASQAHAARLPMPGGRAEQDSAVLEEAAWRCVCELPANLREQVQAIGLTGQMHGVLLTDAGGAAVSPLVTWQDGRCDEAFLRELHEKTGYRLSSGFGCATLAWLREHDALPAGAAGACTIHDYLTERLCGLPHPVTDPTDAASWGLFNLRALDWDFNAIARAGIDRRLLPEVRPSGSLAGHVTPEMAERLGIPAGIPVAVALGDHQASLLATLREPERELALTLGTGGQLSAVVPSLGADGDTWEYRPYPGGRYLLTAASLCGGAAWAWLAEAVKAWLRDLGLPCLADDALYAKLNELGLSAETELTVSPHFLGERHAPALRGCIDGIDLRNFTLGPLARGLARGILTNLREMLPSDACAGRTTLLGSGNALRRNPLLQRLAEETFGLPLVLTEGQEEAATGAAINALRLIR